MYKRLKKGERKMTPRRKAIRFSPLFVFLAVLLAGLLPARAQLARINLYDKMWGFSGAGETRYPWPRHLEMLKDSLNNEIGLACVERATLSDLQRLGISDLQKRLTQLLDGHVLVERAGRYYLTMPVLIGKRREVIARAVREGARTLMPCVEGILSELRAEVKGNEAIVFHLLWSRIIDESWAVIWQMCFSDGSYLPSVDWVIEPEHPFAVGTNSSSLPADGSFSFTWSMHTESLSAGLWTLGLPLYKAARKLPLNQDERKKLQAYGFLDSQTGRNKTFCYESGDRLDSFFGRMRDRYGAEASRAYDFKSLARAVDVDPGEFLIILLHETAYELFENLDRSGTLKFPELLKTGGPAAESVDFMSLQLGHSPKWKEEYDLLLMENNGRADARVVSHLRRTVEKAPGNLDALWALGFADYDVQNYAAALETFQKFNALTERAKDELSRTRHDWSYIWMGHIYDLTGERQRAVAEYKKVLASTATMQMSQYQIGPITAGEWARQRIEKPFERR
jgi:tetratricopeptide (TPR) repeat protein